MGTVHEQTAYQCERCGANDIVAAPLVYQQGTHAYSTRFSSGTSQSLSAKAAAPPLPRRYTGRVIIWGIGVLFSIFWGSAGLRAIARDAHSRGDVEGPLEFILALGLVCFLGMLLSIRKIARYNREVYPRLWRNWERTYFCGRCGNSQFIPPKRV